MKKSISQCLHKSSFLSQRQTMADIIQEKKQGVRFATQYQLSIPEQPIADPNQLELIRIKEKYKWKCEELDRTKHIMEEEHKVLEERANKLSKGEKELRQLTVQIKEKLNQLQQQEQSFKERVSQQEEKQKEREQQILANKQQLSEMQNQIEVEKTKLTLREKGVQEQEHLIKQKVKIAEQYVERLKYSLLNTNQKENYYHQQIEKLNKGLQTIVEHEVSIKNIEFQLGQQVQSLKEAEKKLLLKLQNCKIQEEIFDQRDLNIQASEDLINRKIEWDNKQNQNSAKMSKISKLNSENSRMEVSHFGFSGLSQKY